MEEQQVSVREAMARAVAGLGDPPGLAVRAMADGRRQRRRARVAGGAAAVCAVALAATGLAAVGGPVGNGDGPGVRVQPASAAVPQVFGTVELSPSPAPAGSAGASEGLPDAERARVTAFRQDTAAALQDLLPPGLGRIRLVAGQVPLYLATSSQGSHVIRFSVVPAPQGATERSCAAGEAAKGGTCAEVALDAGTRAVVRVSPQGDGRVTGTSVLFHLGSSDVSVSVSPDERAGVSAPVTADQLLAFVRAPRVLDLVHRADLAPVQGPEVSVDEGAVR
ncbi:hypothetical protein [Kitasatospora sp. NPDC088134]|uniref:hypothetical protein n=1 Tax=Kitasatospora sp. NPDC088134 TaxID=3364071 RepID=UPI00381AB6E5